MVTATAVGGLEFRSYPDDAWYSVTVHSHSDSSLLTVKYAGFPDDSDSLFDCSDSLFFSDMRRVDDFASRFRLVSLQLQDSDCPRVSKGLLVCASHLFRPDDLRFYDALVEAVHHCPHCPHDHDPDPDDANSSDNCSCSFVLSWLHGPNATLLTSEPISHICCVQFRPDVHPLLASFVNRARHLHSNSNSNSNSDSHSIPLRISHNLSFSHHINVNQETRCIEWSLGDPLSSSFFSTWTYGHARPRSAQDDDLGGVAVSHYAIVIDNVENDLTPFALIHFIHRHLSFSPTPFVFPTLSSDPYTRAHLVVDTKAKFNKLCHFLDSSHQIVVSSRGRPWVMTGKMPLNNAHHLATLETLALVSQHSLEKRNIGRSSSGLKVVSSESEEYGAAKQLCVLYKEFSDHHKRLQKRLVVEEGKISMQQNAKRGVPS